MFTFSDIFTPSDQVPCQVAAIDLGSNSFHMIIVQWHRGQLTILDRLKESVRLGWGLGDDGSLNDQSYARAMACLERFGERLRGFKAGSVRVVGTKTLRSLNNSIEFLRDAEVRLGHPVDIISGEEEARLIYLGVSHCLQSRSHKRFLVDIGGGSTEVMVGSGAELNVKASLNMGCVAITKLYFADGHVTDLAIARAHIRCLQQIVPVRERFDAAISADETVELMGASGSIKAVAKVCVAEGWSDGGISRATLKMIKQRYLLQGDLTTDFLGLPEDRKPVFLAGVCVLDALFEGFNFERLCADGMQASPWALREGLVYDWKGRMENRDIRDTSVHALAKRFHVDEDKSQVVEQTALTLLSQVKLQWHLCSPEAEKLLVWSARLFSVGLDIRHSDYHKHSAYIVEQVDIAGCTRREQQQLAALVLAHRKRFPQKKFPMENIAMIRLAVLLRLAVIFHRGRKVSGLPEVNLQAQDDHLQLSLPTDWLGRNPLTEADLQVEQGRLLELGITLQLLAN